MSIREFFHSFFHRASTNSPGNSRERPPREPSKGLSSEDKVIIFFAIFGFVGGIILSMLSLPPIIVAVFLAVGIASLVYRFLGGIQGAKLYTMGIKLGGSLGALIGCALLINTYLQEQKKFDVNKDFTPSTNEWFAIGKNTGLPLKVKIKGVKSPIEKPPLTIFSDKLLCIKHDGNNFIVYPKIAPNFVLGKLDIHNLKENCFFNKIRKNLENFILTDPLPPNRMGVDLDPIPLRLSTKNYGGEYTRYALIDNSNETYEGRIYRRQGEIVKINDKHYLVCVVAVNHTVRENETMFAKFAIGEIKTSIEP